MQETPPTARPEHSIATDTYHATPLPDFDVYQGVVRATTATLARLAEDAGR
jgi:hypothetical protein